MSKAGDPIGFRDQQRHFTDRELLAGDVYAQACVDKFHRDSRDVDAVTAAGAEAFRLRIGIMPHDEIRERQVGREFRSSPEYARFRMDLIRRIGEEKLTPGNVAAILREWGASHIAPHGIDLELEADLLDLSGSDWGVADRVIDERLVV